MFTHKENKMHESVPKEVVANYEQLPTLHEVRSIMDQIGPIIESPKYYLCAREDKKMWYDYWENSTNITGIRTSRIRVYPYESVGPELANEIVAATMGDKHLREVIASCLPDWGYKFYTYRRYDTGLFYVHSKNARQNCLKIWYRSS